MSFKRVSKEHPCLKCGRSDWCLNSDSGDACLCQRVESDRRIGDAGYYHLVDSSKRPALSGARRIRLKVDDGPRPDFEQLSREFEGNICPGDARLLASRLGVTPASLERLRVGLQRDGYYTFPTRDAGKTVGIQIRSISGNKFFITGSKAASFIPANLDFRGPLLITEGVSDCAAGLSLRFNSIGRFNCSSGTDLICRACKGRSEIVIVSDLDEVGVRGARHLAESLSLYCPSVKVVVPPEKDLRMWLMNGLTHEELQDVIDRTETVVQGVRCG